MTLQVHHVEAFDGSKQRLVMSYGIADAAWIAQQCWPDCRCASDPRSWTQNRAHHGGDFLKRGAGWQLQVVRTVAQAEAIAGETRKHVQVNMEDFLAGDFSVRHEKVDPFALQSSLAQRCGESLPDFEHVPTSSAWETLQIGGVRERDNEHMPRINWPDVHESANDVVAEDDARRRAARDDVAKDAGGRSGHGTASEVWNASLAAAR